MAKLLRGPYDTDTYTVSPNATGITYTATNGALAYSSGGIPDAVCVMLDTAGGSSNGDVIVATTGKFIVGVAVDYPAIDIGNPVTIQTSGVARIKAASAITEGDLVYVGDSSGRVATAPAAGATQSYIVGQAETAATIVNDYVTVRLRIGTATNVNA